MLMVFFNEVLVELLMSICLYLISHTSKVCNIHVTFEMAAINDLLDAPKRLKDQGIMPLSFFGIESMEPSVIAWMPAAAIYCTDAYDQLMKYQTMLDGKERRTHIGIVSWSNWIANNR